MGEQPADARVDDHVDGAGGRGDGVEQRESAIGHRSGPGVGVDAAGDLVAAGPRLALGRELPDVAALRGRSDAHRAADRLLLDPGAEGVGDDERARAVGVARASIHDAIIALADDLLDPHDALDAIGQRYLARVNLGGGLDRGLDRLNLRDHAGL